MSTTTRADMAGAGELRAAKPSPVEGAHPADCQLHALLLFGPRLTAPVVLVLTGASLLALVLGYAVASRKFQQHPDHLGMAVGSETPPPPLATAASGETRSTPGKNSSRRWARPC